MPLNSRELTLPLLWIFLLSLLIQGPASAQSGASMNPSLFRTVVDSMLENGSTQNDNSRGEEPRLLRPPPSLTTVGSGAFASSDSGTVAARRTLIKQMRLRVANASRDMTCKGIGGVALAPSPREYKRSFPTYCQDLPPFWTIAISRPREADQTCPMRTGTPIDSVMKARNRKRPPPRRATHIVRVLEITSSSWGVFDVPVATGKGMGRVVDVVECYTISQ